MAAAAVALIILVGLAAAADLPAISFTDPGINPGPRPSVSREPSSPAGDDFDLSDAKDPDKDVAGNLGEVWDVARWVLLAGAAAFMTVVIVRRLRGRHAPAETREMEAPAPPVLAAQVADEAFASAQDELLGATDVSEAIINMWLSLERLVARSGIERRPYETTGEYVVAVLSRLHPDEAPLQKLADVYRRALFDDRRPDEADRRQAHDALSTLRDQLAVSHE